jgi:hypothetical protein
VAALFVLNADNFKVSGTSVGLPTVPAPNIGALTTANNTIVPTKVDSPTNPASDQPSIIIVEFLGFGGGSQADNSNVGSPPKPPAGPTSDDNDRDKRKNP